MANHSSLIRDKHHTLLRKFVFVNNGETKFYSIFPGKIMPRTNALAYFVPPSLTNESLMSSSTGESEEQEQREVRLHRIPANSGSTP